MEHSTFLSVLMLIYRAKINTAKISTDILLNTGMALGLEVKAQRSKRISCFIIKTLKILQISNTEK
jgi:hypothetical protein